MSLFRKALCALTAAGTLTAYAAFPSSADETPAHSGIAVIHVNDVHCSIEPTDTTFGYAELAAYEAKLKAEGYTTVLADAGDFSQGQAVGTLSDGLYVIDIMNSLGFDYAALGNHEFDYGMNELFAMTDTADFKTLSSNFFDLKTNERVYDAWDIYEAGGVKIGIVGITTPKSIGSSDPSHFKDENGEFIYGLCGDKDGAALYKNVQQSVDEVRAAGADYVIALAHLGINESAVPWTSTEVIANTTGIDVLIDGHSHSVITENVPDKNGNDVILTSTGTQMSRIGTVIIENGTVAAGLASREDYTVTTDTDSAEYAAYTEALAAVDRVKSQYLELTETVIGETAANLIVYNPPEIGGWKVRAEETNLGDFCADAYRIMTGADAAIVNGGGIRSDVAKGPVTYGQILAVHPYGNSICMVETTGQQILDALEVGAKLTPLPTGGFLQVSGITYEIHTYIESNIVEGEAGEFVRVDGEYRVKNVMINGEPLDPEKKYKLASHNFIIKNGGSGLSMFMNDELLLDEAYLDNQLLIDYITGELGGVIGEDYENSDGAGRIKIYSQAPAIPEEPAEPDKPNANDPAEEQPEEPETPETPDNPQTGIDLSLTVFIAVTAGASAVIARKNRRIH